jgi:hypothetical protein
MAQYAFTFTSGDTVTPTKLNDARTVSEIVNADIKSDAAIAGTKIAPDFGSQNVVTTGNALINTTAAFADSNTTPKLQLHAISNLADGEVGLFNFENNTNPGIITFAKSRAAADNTHTVVQSGDDLGFIAFEGSDGSAFRRGAIIRAQVDGTPGANDMPGRLVFATTPSGSSTPTERMRIDRTGRIIAAGVTPATSVPGSFCTSGRIHSDGTYDNTVASAANVHVTSFGLFARSTSSRRYKTNIETAGQSYSESAVLNCRPVWFRSTCAEDRNDWSHWGFIAEEIAEIDPRLVQWGPDENGNLRAEGVQYDRFVPHLCAMIQKQQTQIAELSAKVAALEAA